MTDVTFVHTKLRRFDNILYEKKNGHEKVANAIIPGILAPEADNTYKDLRLFWISPEAKSIIVLLYT